MTTQEPTLNEHGDEIHPAFGMITANRVSSMGGSKGGPVGASLFDSEIRHQHYVVLKIDRATRKRDLNRDWIHSSGFGQVAEVAMSEAQWAQFVSSMNTSGTACTLTRTEVDGAVPDLPFAPRMEQSMDEVRGAAERTFAAIKQARDAYEAHKTAANLRNLHFTIENAASNMTFAAESLTEHAENVVQKARSDIEAMVVQHAERLGLDPASTTAALALGPGTEEEDPS